jgi:hypothetical protein
MDSNWQRVERLEELVDNPNAFIQNGLLHPAIVDGLIAKVPGTNAQQLYDTYISTQILNEHFTIDGEEKLNNGGVIYRLIREDKPAPLYLTLIPTKDGASSIVTLWNTKPEMDI